MKAGDLVYLLTRFGWIEERIVQDVGFEWTFLSHPIIPNGEKVESVKVFLSREQAIEAHWIQMEAEQSETIKELVRINKKLTDRKPPKIRKACKDKDKE